MNVSAIALLGNLWVRPKKAEALLDVGHTRLYQLINSGEIEACRDGGATKITVASIHAYIDRQIAKSKNPAAPAP